MHQTEKKTTLGKCGECFNYFDEHSGRARCTPGLQTGTRQTTATGGKPRGEGHTVPHAARTMPGSAEPKQTGENWVFLLSPSTAGQAINTDMETMIVRLPSSPP